MTEFIQEIRWFFCDYLQDSTQSMFSNYKEDLLRIRTNNKERQIACASHSFQTTAPHC